MRTGETSAGIIGLDGNLYTDYRVRVRYAETDQMGVAHHANYFVWFEVGRSEFCRQRGFFYQLLDTRSGAVCATGETLHVVGDSRGKPKSFPARFRKLLGSSHC